MVFRKVLKVKYVDKVDGDQRKVSVLGIEIDPDAGEEGYMELVWLGGAALPAKLLQNVFKKLFEVFPEFKERLREARFKGWWRPLWTERSSGALELYLEMYHYVHGFIKRHVEHLLHVSMWGKLNEIDAYPATFSLPKWGVILHEFFRAFDEDNYTLIDIAVDEPIYLPEEASSEAPWAEIIDELDEDA